MAKSDDEYVAVGGDALDREIERLIIQSAAGDRGQAELNSDEEATNVLHQRNFARNGGNTYGRIVYSMPFASWYRVFLDDLNGDAPCCYVGETSVIPFSVRDTSPLTAGQGVLVWWPPEGSYGYILGVVPPKVEDGNLGHPDWVSQGSNVGFKREAYYHQLLDLCNDGAGVIDFSNSRPVDGLGAGEWGRMSDTGIGILIDAFMAYLRADETCGLWLFYLDRLARLAGHNFDLRTAIAEMMVRDDSGEGLHFSGFSPYAWEAIGAWAFGDEIHQEKSDQDVQYKKPFGKLEPLQDKQQPFYRMEEFRGYLGQAFMRQVMAPPAGATQGINTYDSEQPRVGLFREQISLDGAYCLESAHSIIIAKRALIPIPKRLKQPEDTQGDTFSEEGGDYKFASKHGAGDEHKINSVKANGDNPQMQEVAALTDFAAHAFEWKGLHPFHYHKKDFNTPEQADLNPLTALQSPPQFTQLASQQWVSPPEARQVRIDHRYNETDYFETASGFFLLPRGGAVMRGGAGEEVRLAGGSADISAPGDVWLRPGRNVNIIAADDCIIKVHKSCDITAAKGDIRLKSQRNVHLLGGNDSIGGVIIESRASGPSYEFDKDGEDVAHGGILFVAPKSEVVTWGKSIYLRTGGGEGEREVEQGPIVLDASKGESDIRTVSRAKLNHIKLIKSDTFAVEGDKEVANNYSALNAQIHTPLQCDGGLVLTKNGLLMKGFIAVVAGHIGTEFAPQYNYFVGGLVGQPLAEAKAAIAEVLASMEEFKQAMGTDYQLGVENFWYDDKRPGNDEVMEQGRFSLRTDEQMNTEEWSLPEAHWQQLARLTDQTFQPWEEEDVAGNEGDQQPYPGKTAWEGETFYQIDLKLHDPSDGRDKPRDSGLYEEPELEDWTKAIPKETYPIIVQ